MITRSLKLCITVKKDEREYNFLVPEGSPGGEAYDACFEVLQEVLKMANETAKRAEQKHEEPKKEEPKE